MSGASRSCYAKSWDPVFSTPREFNDDFPRSYTDKKRELGAAGDGIELFLLDDVEGSDPDDTVEELKKFTASVTLEDLNAASETTGQRQGAWLDVRSSLHSGNTSQTFTASRLYVHLKRRRIGNQNALVANRCLTYIKKLDALYMLALAEMAAQHEVPLLRDAFRKHHNRQTSLQVTISANFKVFQLQFHLNYFKLGPLPPENEADHRGTTSNTGKWIDLSFLQAQTPKSPGGRTQGMFQAQFSLAICGSAESRWAAYAFDDTESEFVEDDFYDKIFPCGRDGYHPDPIASCLPDDDTDADLPIWNSREYFLIVVARRVARAAHSWEALVRLVERRIKEHRAQHPSTLAQLDSRKRGRSETVKTFDWTRQTKELVDLLRKTLSEANKYWEHFNSVNGDIDYFTDVKSPADPSNRITQLLREVNETFQKLERLQRNLDDLSVLCKDSENALQLRLILESSEATKANGATTDFTLFVLGPIALAAACMQLAPSVISLPPSRETFVILAVIFMVAVKIVYKISRALPGVSWWWRTIRAPVKAMKLENMRNLLSVCALSRFLRKHSSDVDRKAQDVEMVPVQS